MNLRSSGRAQRILLPLLLLGGGVVCALTSFQLTSAAYTDTSAPRLGTTGSLGGSYDIAMLDATNAVVQGNPTPLTLSTSGAGAVNLTPTISSTVSARVVTTTAVTGPVTMSLYNAFSGARPADPNGTNPGVDPYNFALYTVSVDGVVVASRVSATAFNALAVTITGWTQSVSKSITVDMALPRANASPYLFNRTLVLGIRFNGSSS